MALTACGGGGGDESDVGAAGGAAAAPSPSPADPAPAPPIAPPAPSGPGSLTVTGPGGASVAGAFTPATLGTLSTAGPDCGASGGTTVCSSNYAVGWTESSSERMVVIFGSTALPAPGLAPGVGINSINLAYSVFLSNGFVLICGPINGTTCDFRALGVTLDTAARTVTFVNTPLSSPAAGGDGAVVNGTIGY